MRAIKSSPPAKRWGGGEAPEVVGAPSQTAHLPQAVLRRHAPCTLYYLTKMVFPATMRKQTTKLQARPRPHSVLLSASFRSQRHRLMRGDSTVLQ